MIFLGGKNDHEFFWSKMVMNFFGSIMFINFFWSKMIMNFFGQKWS